MLDICMQLAGARDCDYILKTDWKLVENSPFGLATSSYGYMLDTFMLLAGVRNQ